jgi:hypothetical protein
MPLIQTCPSSVLDPLQKQVLHCCGSVRLVPYLPRVLDGLFWLFWSSLENKRPEVHRYRLETALNTLPMNARETSHSFELLNSQGPIIDSLVCSVVMEAQVTYGGCRRLNN